MPGPHRNQFWDRETDREGRLLRVDVRNSALEVWKKACRMADYILGDSTDAAEILESCVARVSRHLDKRNVPLFAQQVQGLLLVAFRNALRSLAQKRRRMQPIVDGGALDVPNANANWEHEVQLNLDLAKLVRQLSTRSRVILRLRHAGYQWKEVAALLGVTVPNARSSFWREIEKLQAKFAKVRPQRVHHPSQHRGKLPKKLNNPISSDSIEDLSDSEPDITLIFNSRPPPWFVEVSYSRF